MINFVPFGTTFFVSGITQSSSALLISQGTGGYFLNVSRSSN